MNTLIPPPLKELASALSRPLYVVGGSVRDFLAGYSATLTDWDICSPASETEVQTAAEHCGFHVNAVYRNTGTVKLTDRDGTTRRYAFKEVSHLIPSDTTLSAPFVL